MSLLGSSTENIFHHRCSPVIQVVTHRKFRNPVFHGCSVQQEIPDHATIRAGKGDPFPVGNLIYGNPEFFRKRMS